MSFRAQPRNLVDAAAVSPLSNVIPSVADVIPSAAEESKGVLFPMGLFPIDGVS